MERKTPTEERQKKKTTYVISRNYYLTPMAIRWIREFATKNECGESEALRAIIRIALNKTLEDEL